MNIEVVDTNIVVRFLRGDDVGQLKQVRQWLREAEVGRRKLLIKPIVIAEVCFVLESFYKVSREEIASKLQIFLRPGWLDVEEREVLMSIWSHYLNNFHFVDSYLLAWTEVNRGEVLTFDRKVKKAGKI